MEEIRKILQQSDIELLDSSDGDSDVSYENKLVQINKSTNIIENSNSKRKRNGSERLPTRRPDPNVYNRNALLARENRRKKKAYLETIEKELEEARNINRILKKALKKQRKVALQLEKEKLYFKNILSNHAEIKKLISSLNQGNPAFVGGACISSESSVCSNYCSSRSSSYEPDGVSSNFEKSENGSVTSSSQTNMNTLLSSTNIFLDNFFTDYEPTTEYDDTWKQLLEENCFPFCESTKVTSENQCNVNIDDSTTTIPFVSDDHSYVRDSVCVSTSNLDLPTTLSTIENTGICLHITSGKLSLEFCPSCHWNANRTPPTQLLQDDAEYRMKASGAN